MTYSALARPGLYIARRPTSTITAPAFALPDVSRFVLYVVLACLLGLLYLVQVTKTDALGYKLNDYQTQTACLQAEKNDLTLQAARAQNLDRVAEYGDVTGMVATAPQ